MEHPLPALLGGPCGSSKSTTWGLRTFLPLAAILAVKEALVDFEVGALRYEDLEIHPTPGHEELLVLEPFFGDYCEIWILHDDGPPSGRMPYQKWCRVYYQSWPSQGVVMLLIDKVDGANWTSVDPRGRVQVVNNRDRRRVQNAPRPQVNYTDMPGFSQAQLIMFEKKSAVLIQRRVGSSWSGEGSKPKPGTKKAGSSRRRALLWGMEALGWGAALTTSWSGGLGLGAGALLSWRVGRYFGLWEMAIAASSTVQQTINAFEDALEFMDRVDEMYYEGSLELYVIFFFGFVCFIGVGIPLLRGAWRQATEYLGVSPTVSPQSTLPASLREYGSSASEVGEDAGLSDVMKGIMKQQMDLAEQMAQLKARPDAGTAECFACICTQQQSGDRCIGGAGAGDSFGHRPASLEAGRAREHREVGRCHHRREHDSDVAGPACGSPAWTAAREGQCHEREGHHRLRRARDGRQLRGHDGAPEALPGAPTVEPRGHEGEDRALVLRAGVQERSIRYCRGATVHLGAGAGQLPRGEGDAAARHDLGQDHPRPEHGDDQLRGDGDPLSPAARAGARLREGPQAVRLEAAARPAGAEVVDQGALGALRPVRTTSAPWTGMSSTFLEPMKKFGAASRKGVLQEVLRQGRRRLRGCGGAVAGASARSTRAAGRNFFRPLTQCVGWTLMELVFGHTVLTPSSCWAPPLSADFRQNASRSPTRSIYLTLCPFLQVLPGP